MIVLLEMLRSRRGDGLNNSRREVAQRDARAVRQNLRPFDHIGQLADIAGPRMGEPRVTGFLCAGLGQPDGARIQTDVTP